MKINKTILNEINVLVKTVSEINTLLNSEEIIIAGSSRNFEGNWREDARFFPDKEKTKAFLTDYRNLLIKRLDELGFGED